jgi:hypothetical protein
MIRLFLILCLSVSIAFADNGDTTTVQVHNNVDMTWYGHYKKWGEFPTDGSFRKVLMHFDMGCASSGCSGWDYDVHILLRNRTNKLDSNLVLAPSYSLDGSSPDTIQFSYSPTYVSAWDSISGDTAIANDTLVLVWYQDANDPFLATDTQYLYAANYYNMTYDSAGTVIDSVWVAADTTLYLSNTDTYNVYEIIEDFELGRAITPYGTYMNPANGSYGTNGYDENWKHRFTYDVTDFQHLLKDSVEIDAFYAGWSSGFSVTLNFEFIEGTPPRMPISLSNVYKNGAASYGYSNSANFESAQMPEVKVATSEYASSFKLQFVPTGHGQSGEFTSGVSYTAKVNGSVVGGENIWKDDCGFNAIWPQGGTWIFDRANWCPGEAVPIFNHEITPYITAGDSALFDINFSNYNPSNAANYSCAVHFFQYKEPNFELDAEVIDIISPSLKDQYSRLNPVCSNPVIKIRNSGTQELTALTIQYGIKGGSMQTQQWTGNLKFMQEEEVSLGQIINDGTENIFEVSVSAPNGNTDMHSDNDFMASAFEDVPVYKNQFLVRLKTNNYGAQNSWKIENSLGEIVYSKDNFASNTLNADTVILGNGCFKFTLEDSGGDGLDFWYWDNVGQPDGSGFINFMYYDTISVFKTFHKDFGSRIVHSFRVENATSMDDQSMEKFEVYPTQTNGLVHIKSTATNEEKNLQLFDVKGQLLLQKQWFEAETDIDLSGFSDGIYFVKLKTVNSLQTKKIIFNNY